MIIIGAYILVALLIFIVIWAVMRRRGKKTGGTWNLSKHIAELEELQRQALK